MLSERDIELAHPEAFDFAFGNLRADKLAEFNRHLPSCRHCQSVVDEYSEIGGIIKLVPPEIEPSAALEERTVAAMVTAMSGEERTAANHSPGDGAQTGTLVDPPERERSAETGTQLQVASTDPHDRPVVTRLPVSRRYRGRLAAIVAVAAAIIIAAAIALPHVTQPRQARTAQLTVAISLHATSAAKAFGVGAASGQATAHQADESWTFDLTVRGLKPLPGNDVYQCWWAGPGSSKAHPFLITGGSFVVGDSGSTTLTMTTGVDPRQFTRMEITVETPGNGAVHGAVLLTGQGRTT
jgi:hypothetical protein